MFFTVRKNSYFRLMFHYGFLSVNLFYLVFAALYLVSLGLFSVNRLIDSKSESDIADIEHCKLIETSDLQRNPGDNTYCYCDYFLNTVVQKQVHNISRNTIYPPLHLKIPVSGAVLLLTARSPPIV